MWALHPRTSLWGDACWHRAKIFARWEVPVKQVIPYRKTVPPPYHRYLFQSLVPCANDDEGFSRKRYSTCNESVHVESFIFKTDFRKEAREKVLSVWSQVSWYKINLSSSPPPPAPQHTHTHRQQQQLLQVAQFMQKQANQVLSSYHVVDLDFVTFPSWCILGVYFVRAEGIVCDLDKVWQRTMVQNNIGRQVLHGNEKKEIEAGTGAPVMPATLARAGGGGGKQENVNLSFFSIVAAYIW